MFCCRVVLLLLLWLLLFSICCPCLDAVGKYAAYAQFIYKHLCLPAWFLWLVSIGSSCLNIYATWAFCLHSLAFAHPIDKSGATMESQVGAIQMPAVKNWDTFLMMYKYLPCSTMAISHLKTIEKCGIKANAGRVRKLTHHKEHKSLGNKEILKIKL